MTAQAAEATLKQAEAALARRDPAGALAVIRQAEAQGAASPQLAMCKAVALRASGDLGAALEALDAVLVMEPYHFMAMLSKASLVERLGRPKDAVPTYRSALKIAPPRERLPAAMAAQLDHAEAVVRANAEETREHLRSAVGDRLEALPRAERARLAEALDIFAGVKRAYAHEPLLLHYPRLPAIPFYDEADFPWLGELEAATPVIRAELEALLESGAEGFAPYIQYPPGAPVNQWKQLNHSRLWSSWFLWKDGARQDEACARCPQTAAVLESLPMCRQPSFAPTAMFSALEARTRIPPHTGSTNVRLLTHLPLILPGPAGFRVGNETRHWEMGKAWVFDDSIDHEAWNDADALRVILIFDVWNPLLSEAERELVTTMMLARRAFKQA